MLIIKKIYSDIITSEIYSAFELLYSPSKSRLWEPLLTRNGITSYPWNFIIFLLVHCISHDGYYGSVNYFSWDFGLEWSYSSWDSLLFSLMALVVEFELYVVEYLDAYNECVELVTKFGWLPFLQKFSGFNFTVTKSFALVFDGNISRISDVRVCLSSNKVFIGGLNMV